MQSIPATPAWTRSLVLAVCLLIINLPQIHGAAPPANDTCATAEVIPATAGLSTPHFTSTVADIRSATTNGEPPLTNACGIDMRGTLWYRFQPAANGNYTFSTAFDTGTTLRDTAMAIYTIGNGCGSLSPLPEVACNDDSGVSHNRAAITATLTSTLEYFIVIWSAVALDTNDVVEGYAVQLKVTFPVAPTNDACAGAQSIPSSVTLPHLTGVTDNTLATDDQDPTCAPEPSEGVPSRDVWYQFTPPASGTYIFSTGADTATTVEDTLLAIYSSPSPCGALTEVACNNNTSGRAVVSLALTAGTRYYIVVWDNDEEPIPGSTLVELRVSRAAPPSVTTLTAVNISSIGALLKGTVNPNGLQTRYWFEWGPNTGLGNTSQVRLLLAGTTTQAAEATISTTSFTANAPYHYQIVSTNAMGTNRGPVLTFVWSNTRPALGAPDLLDSGAFRFEFNNGNPGQLYMIQGATDFGAPSPWTDLGLAINVTNVSPTLFQFTHQGAAVAPYRFYRARLP